MLRKLEEIEEELRSLRGTPRSDRAAHNRRSTLYARRKRLTFLYLHATNQTEQTRRSRNDH